VLSAAKTLFIVAAVAAGLAGGVATARFAGPLGFLSFHINGTVVNSTANLTLVPVYLDLGTLNEGQVVNATGTGEITVPATGNYSLYIVAPGRYGRLFQYFNVTVTIDGEKVYELSLLKPVAQVELSEGEHTVQVTLNAKVGTHLPSITVSHAPFLAISSPGPHTHNTQNNTQSVESQCTWHMPWHMHTTPGSEGAPYTGHTGLHR